MSIFIIVREKGNVFRVLDAKEPGEELRPLRNLYALCINHFFRYTPPVHFAVSGRKWFQISCFLTCVIYSRSYFPQYISQFPLYS